MSLPPLSRIEGGVRLALLVQPRASRARLGPLHGERIKVSITSPPVDGAANQAVVALLAKIFGVAKRNVNIEAGQSSRRKTVTVMGITLAKVNEAIQ